MHFFPTKKSISSGFTLIELLVVIAIIGLLSSIVLASLNSARGKGKDAQRKANLTEVRTALELYYDAHGGYPNSGPNWNSQCGGWTQTTAQNEVPGLVADKDIAGLPTDPDQNASSNTCCYLYYSGAGTVDYKFMLYNCPTSQACADNRTGQASGFVDPVRYNSCAVYTAGASGW